MTASYTDTPFDRVVLKLDPQSKLLRTWELKGGFSALVTALEVERSDGRREKVIVRQHGAADLQHNPQIAADEFRLLDILHSAGVAAPMPYYVDQSGEIFPTPYLVLEYIEGETVFALADVPDLILQLARQLASIHQIDCSKLDVSFLPGQAQRSAHLLRARPEGIDASGDEGRVRAVLAAAWPWPQRNSSVLLHGDFWPGNVLWRDGGVVAMIDWEDAALGDPLADVANSRLEMLWAFGSEAMQRFTEQYQALHTLDWGNLPYWDLYAALRVIGLMDEWDTDASARETRHERHRWFIAQALEQTLGEY